MTTVAKIETAADTAIDTAADKVADDGVAPSKPAPLAALLPAAHERLDADAILARFMTWVSSTGLELYPAQEEALLEIMADKHVVLNTPTGSGKSLVATALHFKALAEGKTSFYTCPIKALVSEKFFALCQLFGPENVGMMTGDATINRDAPLICCTAEILANMALRDADARVDTVVMDEFHYYADRERGAAWQIPLLGLERTTFLLMSATLGDIKAVEDGLRALTGRDVATVRSRDRPVPLDFDYRETPLHETIEELTTSRRAPIYLVNFTQRAAAEEAQSLMSVALCSKDEKDAIRAALAEMGTRFDSPYGKDVQRFVRHGVGLHHAGLLPKYRLLVEKLAQRGLLKIVSGTDTLGVGVNVPIRTVLFTQLCKFDGEKVAVLGVRDFQQIAGRAGRKGFDERGSVVAQAPAHVVENRRLAAKQAAGKKVVMQKPAAKGYVHFDKGTFDRLVNGTPEPLTSRFEVTHGMLLNCLQSERSAALPRGAKGDRGPASGSEPNPRRTGERSAALPRGARGDRGPASSSEPEPRQTIRRGGGYARLVQIIGRSHGGARAKSAERRRAAACFRALRAAGIIDVVTTEAARGREGAGEAGGAGRGGRPSRRVEVSGALQRDFSLNQTLSLYLLEALGALDRDAPTYALDVLTLVESILENPDVVLRRQLDKLKTERLDQLKADGVEYEQRIAELETMEWPKPNRDFIYETFNAFAARHPWVGETNIQPKSVAREMCETFASFDDYVRDYSLQRSEGVLMRYLSQVWKTLEQTVPLAARTGDVLDLLAHLRVTLREVDSSLLDEWESLKDPGARAARAPVVPRVLDATLLLLHDRRALTARVRAELHRLVRALAARDFETAATLVVADVAEPWTPERLSRALAPYFTAHKILLTTPAARAPSLTRLDEAGPRLFRAQQTLLDPEGDADWSLDCLVDLTSPRADDAPLLDLQRIGV